jgi:hypothetical protein
LIYSGPDSRPSNEEESEQTANPSDPSTEAPPGRNPQNFFMQRMSDLLTQLVTRTTSEPEESESIPTPNNTRTNQSPIITETNEANTASTATRTSPIIQTPPSPSRAQSSATNHNDDEDDNESDVSFFLSQNILFTFSSACWNFRPILRCKRRFSCR